MNVIITTERLWLRAFTEADSVLIYNLNSDPEVTRFTCDPVTDQAQAKKILDEVILPQYVLHKAGRWAVHLRLNGEFLGWCGLKYISERNEVDLGYRFMKNYWGKGYATEAASSCLNYGFNKLKLERIVARVLPGNLPSIRVLEKCGMRYLGEEVMAGHLHKTYQIISPVIPR